MLSRTREAAVAGPRRPMRARPALRGSGRLMRTWAPGSCRMQSLERVKKRNAQLQAHPFPPPPPAPPSVSRAGTCS